MFESRSILFFLLIRLLLIPVCLCAFSAGSVANLVTCVEINGAPCDCPGEDETDGSFEALALSRLSTRKRGRRFSNQCAPKRAGHFSLIRVNLQTRNRFLIAVHVGHELSNGLRAPLLI